MGNQGTKKTVSKHNDSKLNQTVWTMQLDEINIWLELYKVIAAHY